MRANDGNVRIVVADDSVIIRSGLLTVVKRLTNLKAISMEVASMEALKDCLQMQTIDVLIVNPNFSGAFDIDSIKEEFPQVKVVAVLSSLIEQATLAKYVAHFSILDSAQTIGTLLEQELFGREKQRRESVESSNEQVLSQREQEIVVCVVKGMLNKEIAEKLFLSIHTVITHRRNISRKLQIHSSAALAIYAIVNNLVDIKEVKQR